MNENTIKKRYDHSLDLFDWMLAIDFDAVELRSSHISDPPKRVIILDINAARSDASD